MRLLNISDGKTLNYDHTFIVMAEESPMVEEAARSLAAKHPRETTTCLKWDPVSNKHDVVFGPNPPMDADSRMYLLALDRITSNIKSTELAVRNAPENKPPSIVVSDEDALTDKHGITAVKVGGPSSRHRKEPSQPSVITFSSSTGSQSQGLPIKTIAGQSAPDLGDRLNVLIESLKDPGGIDDRNVPKKISVVSFNLVPGGPSMKEFGEALFRKLREHNIATALSIRDGQHTIAKGGEKIPTGRSTSVNKTTLSYAGGLKEETARPKNYTGEISSVNKAEGEIVVVRDDQKIQETIAVGKNEAKKFKARDHVKVTQDQYGNQKVTGTKRKWARF